PYSACYLSSPAWRLRYRSLSPPSMRELGATRTAPPQALSVGPCREAPLRPPARHGWAREVGARCLTERSDGVLAHRSRSHDERREPVGPADCAARQGPTLNALKDPNPRSSNSHCSPTATPPAFCCYGPTHQNLVQRSHS